MAAPVLSRVRGYDALASETEVRGVLGAALAADWRLALVARGLGWHFDAGAFSTPIVGGGNGTVLDQDQPEFGVSVPSGFTIIPTRIHVQCQPPISAADADECEILLAVDRSAAYAGDGTVVLETPVNMRTNAVGGCPATCFSAGTGNITNPTLGMELGRAVKTVDYVGTPANALFSDLSFLYEPLVPPFLVGPCAIYGYWGGTVATSGFANVQFLVIPSNLITALS
jgi:hypothetical protein